VAAKACRAALAISHRAAIVTVRRRALTRECVATRRPSNAILGVDSLDADGRAGRSLMPSLVADAVTKMPQARANGCEQVREAAR
jgi:hypothetical protein